MDIENMTLEEKNNLLSKLISSINDELNVKLNEYDVIIDKNDTETHKRNILCDYICFDDDDAEDIFYNKICNHTN